MSPVSSSTLTCAAARCCNARGSSCTSGRSVVLIRHPLPRRRRPPPVASPLCRDLVLAVAGHRLDVDQARPGLHDAGEEGVVLAQRMPLERRREIEVPQRGVAVEGDAEHLPAFALVPVGARVHRHPRLHEHAGFPFGHGAGLPFGHGAGLPFGHGAGIDVDLQRDARVLAGRLDVREHLETSVGSGCAVRDLGGLDGRRRVAAGLVTLARCRLPVDRRDEGQVVALDAARDLGCSPPRVAPHPHDRRTEVRGALDHRVAELRLEAREQVGVRVVERMRVGLRNLLDSRFRRLDSGFRGIGLGRFGGLGPGHVTQRRSAPRASASRARRCRSPRSGSAPGAGRCPATAPRGAAGSRARTRRRG